MIPIDNLTKGSRIAPIMKSVSSQLRARRQFLTSAQEGWELSRCVSVEA